MQISSVARLSESLRVLPWVVLSCTTIGMDATHARFSGK